jgi:EAL domain-containing protein (putative c-di-GMP-specific phosphodiesterase class I)
MATCAEGVETRQQLTYLRNEGCSEVQGYYFSKPKPAGDIALMIKHGFGSSGAPSISPANEDADIIVPA